MTSTKIKLRLKICFDDFPKVKEVWPKDELVPLL